MRYPWYRGTGEASQKTMWERGEIRVGDEGLWTRRGMKMVFWMMCLRSRQTQTLDIKRSSNACLVNRIEMKSMEGREARVERWFATGMRLVLPSLPRSPPPAPFSRLGLVKERQVDLIRIRQRDLRICIHLIHRRCHLEDRAIRVKNRRPVCPLRIRRGLV